MVVEDERSLREGLEELLTGAGHEVVTVADGRTALETGTRESFELVLLDLMLPGLDGLEVCRRLRQVRPQLPVLMLTARGSEDDKVAGFAAGADDYVAKPFGIRELLARIDAFARRARTAPADAEVVEAAGCRFDFGRLVAHRDDGSVSLTPREVGILRWLYQHRRRAVSRAELLAEIWGLRADLQTRTVDMTIAKLRQKVERDPSKPEIVVTVTGVGYAWGNANET